MLEVMPRMFGSGSADYAADRGADEMQEQVASNGLSEEEATQIVSEIGRYLRIQLSSSRKSLTAAYRIGARLLTVKERLPHGSWMKWLAANTKIKIKTADNWMALARHRDIVTFGVRNRQTTTEVLTHIRELEAEKPKRTSSTASRSQAAASNKKVAAGRSDAAQSTFAVDHLRSLCELLKDAPSRFPDDIHEKLVPLVETFVTQVDKILEGEV